jgi:putative endonuclease
MQNNSKKIGFEGEDTAKNYLLSIGYEILETNWRYKKYEVDIIAKINQTIVFIEVKTRKSNTFGEPEIFVTKQKQQFLIAAANQYVIQKNSDLESRFDIVAIIYNNSNSVVKHLEAAFYPRIK